MNVRGIAGLAVVGIIALAGVVVYALGSGTIHFIKNLVL